MSRTEPRDFPGGVKTVDGVRLGLPALPTLDPGDRPVRHLVVEAVVDRDDLLAFWMNPVDREMEVPVVGIAVERIDGLVFAKTHLPEEHLYRLVGLGGRRLLTLAPAQDPVLHRLRAPPRRLGQVDHFLHLGETARR